MINIKEYKKLNIEDIYKDIESDLDNLYNTYSLTDLTKDTYITLVKKLISSFNVDNKDIKDNVNPFLIDYINKGIRSYFCIQINEQGKTNYIFNYLNNAFKKDNIEENIKSFKSFCLFLNNCKISLSYNLISSFFQNEYFSNTLEYIYTNNKYKMQNETYKYNSEAEYLIISSYLETKNIDIEDTNDESEKAYDGSVSIYLKQITHRILTREEEVELAIKCKTGSEASRKKYRKQFAEYNLRLVINIAKKYQGLNVEFGDLIGFGNEGLMKAIDKFDVEKGFKFSTFAPFWIRQSITRAIGDTSRTIRIPIHTLDRLNKYKRAYKELTKELGYEPTVEEVAHKLGWDPLETRKLLTDNVEAVSLNSHVGEEEESELGDFVADENAINPEEAALDNIEKINLGRILEYAYKCKINDDTRVISKSLQMSEREIAVLVLRNGVNLPKEYDYLMGGKEYIKGKVYTLEQIGEMYDITRERIRQIESKSMRKLSRLAELFKQGKILGNIEVVIPRDKSLYEELPEYTKEEIECAVLSLSDNEKIILAKRANQMSEWNQVLENKFRTIILPKIISIITGTQDKVDYNLSVKLERELLSNDVYNLIMYGNFNVCGTINSYTINKLYNGRLFKSLLDNQSEFDKNVITLRFTKENNQYRTLKQIGDILNISESDVSIILGNFLMQYRNSLDNILSMLKK